MFVTFVMWKVCSLAFFATSLITISYRKYKRRSGYGKVYLIGAGPGAFDLITLRGLEILKKADIVMTDRLVSPSLLQYCKPHTEILNVGKGPEKDRFSQKELEKELVIAAKRVGSSGIVVRLKGGDPYVFGLGGSEVEVLEGNNISWEYIPGLSSSTSLPGLSLNVPLTHKGLEANKLANIPNDENHWRFIQTLLGCIREKTIKSC